MRWNDIVYPVWRKTITACNKAITVGHLHHILVGVVEVEGVCGVGHVRHLQDHIQAHIIRLPGVAAQGNAAVKAVEFLDELEAVVDELEVGGQSLVVIDLLLHPSAHVVILKLQTVSALGGLDHAVFAVPDLYPTGCRIHGPVGHGAVEVIGGDHLGLPLGHGGVLVELVGGVGPGYAGLVGGDAVADGVVGVGVGVRCVHVGHRARDFGAVVVGVGDDVGRRVGGAGAGHGGSPADSVIRIAVGGDRTILHLGDEVAVCLIGPGRGDAVGAGHLRDQVAVGQAGVVEIPGGSADLVQAAMHVVTIAVVGNAVNGQAEFPALHAGSRSAAGQRFVVQAHDGLGDVLELGIVGEGAGADDIRDRGRLARAGVGIGDIRRIIGIVDADEFAGGGVVGIGRCQRVGVGVSARPGAGRELPVQRVGVGRPMAVGKP